jgi:predicted DNA-binding ribbon-helix-helix protein
MTPDYQMQAPTTDLQVRGIERPLWAQLKAQAALRSVPIGRLLNEIIREWLAQHGR